MISVLLIIAVGIALSALFSGAETGFYRVTRARLLIDALTGDWIARGLLWTTNHPSLFVATTLVGNNLANYIVSGGVVMGTQRLFPEGSDTAELTAPLFLAPLVFIYGELLPKHVFFDAPNRLLRRSSPCLALAGVLFAPVTAVLWCFGKFLQMAVRQSPQIIELVLARRELASLLAEGHKAGILQPSQQALVQATFSHAVEPIQNFVEPHSRYACATTSMKPQDVIWLARRQRRALVPVEEPSGKRRLLGYLRLIDLILTQRGELPPLRPLITFRANESYLACLKRLIEADGALGRVVSDAGKTLGFVTEKGLSEVLLRGE